MAFSLKGTFSIHISSQTKTEFNYVEADSLVDYPSDWFLKNPGKKPPVTVPKCELSPEDIYKAARGGIRSASLTLATAKLVLYQFGLTVKDICDEIWMSFGTRIADVGMEISPWSLVDIVRGVDYLPPESIAVPSQRDPNQLMVYPASWTPKALTLYILCVYRILNITNEDYRALLLKRMEDQLKAEGGAGMSFHGPIGIYGSWLSDKNFLKMVAAYDMFFYRFKGHEHGILRLGSIGSRFRDCAGLLSIGHAMKILNIEVCPLINWIFIRRMGYEMLRMTKEGQESGEIYSYFPYQVDLDLVSRSAFSSNANPYLFHWIHIIGSLIGHRRSINTVFNFEGSFADVGLNAVLLTWVFARGGELAPKLHRDGRLYAQDVEPMDAGDEEDIQATTPEDKIWVETTSRDPSTWYAILKMCGFRVPPVVVRFINRQRGKIGEVRDGSVGEHVKDHLVYYYFV